MTEKETNCEKKTETASLKSVDIPAGPEGAKYSILSRAFDLISSWWGPFNLQSHLFIFCSTILFSCYVIYTNFSRRDGTTLWDDLTNGMPERGELGLGKFTIYGVTYPFEYPFRLAIRTIPSAVTPWLCYIPHQLGQFVIISKARAAKKRGDLDWTDGNHWNPYSFAMFQLNLFFVVVHYFQTRYFYNGLAATFPEISTLFAGVSSILVAFCFKIKGRGLIFYWTPVRNREDILSFGELARQYHGYLASFGITITFWYHCMESTFAHVTGFIHIFLLLWQSSLIYQKAHRNHYWTVLLEMWIVVHASVVAYFQGMLKGGLHAMFLTSFVLLFIMGPVWSLPFVQKFLGEENGNNRKWRYYLLLSSMLGLYTVWMVNIWVSLGEWYYIPLCLALPALYYFFVYWYYFFYVSGKRVDSLLVGKFGVSRGGKFWTRSMFAWGTLSIWSIMFISEFIYRMFVPYSR